MIRPAVQLGLVRAHVERQNAAVVQTCVPTVAINGPSFRLKGRLDALRARPDDDPDPA
jgi:hypothetical protein